MKHPGIKRAAPKGTDWWRCPSCLTEGPIGDLLKSECSGAPRQSQERELLQAIDGVGKYARDGEA